MLAPGDRQAQPSATFRGAAQAVDRRALAGVSQPLSPTGARLRALRANRRCVHPTCHDPGNASPLENYPCRGSTMQLHNR